MGVIYYSFVDILAYYSYTLSCISTFRPIVNYNEVGNLQEVQMNISSNMRVNDNPTLSKDRFTRITCMLCVKSNVRPSRAGENIYFKIEM